jgi:hypothetical protein
MKKMLSLRDTAMELRSQMPLHVQGGAGHSGYQGGGPENNNTYTYVFEIF